ncbi:MAG: radical SAM family heme chaperone HemW [Paludibacteraceae bacterium]|nr:radical SAM family heme chaperone HemW [Paludibacteraceae bacterium]
MAGLYIHIPFCTQKCIYCDFMSGTNLSLRQDFVASLIAEMDLYLDFFASDPMRTIYFGGGTPSLLSVDELQRIYDAIAQRWDISVVEEFTIECNPDDLTEEYLLQLRSLPINRLSIGVQSFCDDELQWLNRRHTSQEAFDVVLRAQKAGFENITIDLMFALPVQTLESLNYSIDKALELGVQHISAYSLMFEPDSKITKLMELNRLQPLDEDVAADMFELLSARLTSAGYEQYEISNYAKQGFHSRHNSGYWHGMRYLGLGPSAHSFDGEKRWSNIAHTIKYNAQFQSPDMACCVLTSEASQKTTIQLSIQVEELTLDERFNELVFTALRTKIGVDLQDLRLRFGDMRCDRFLRQAQKYIDAGNMHMSNNRIALTHSGIYISDSIISDFMIV